MQRLLLCLVALGLFLGVTGTARADFDFTTIDVPGATHTVAPGINNDGQIVGWYVGGGTTHAYLLSEGSYTTLDVPGVTATAAQGINDSGQIVGRYGDRPFFGMDPMGGIHHGYLRQSDGSFAAPLDPPGSTFSEAYGINAAGQIVGWYLAGSTQHGFVLSGNSYTTIDVPGSASSQAFAINDAGQIVGSYIDAGGIRHGYLRDEEGSYATFDPPGSTLTQAFGINDAGQIVGSYAAGGRNHGFLLSEGSYTVIDVPGSTLTAAIGINNSGQIVGRYDDASGHTHGFLATPVDHDHDHDDEDHHDHDGDHHDHDGDRGDHDDGDHHHPR